MKLRGQARRPSQQGYAMAALLVAMSVMAVAMTVVMPVWKQITQREKEAELVFRGQQYMRAIGLFQRKSGPGVLPPSIDVLVDQRFLRHKYKDPITGGDFLLIPGALPASAAGQIQASAASAQSASRPAGRPNSGTPAASPYVAQGGPLGTVVPGGIAGVVSKSTDTSIRIFNGRSHYNEWEFRFVAPVTPQGGDGGRGGPQRGGPVGPNGRGFPIGPDGRGGPNDGRGRGIDGRGGPIDDRGRMGPGGLGGPGAPGSPGGPPVFPGGGRGGFPGR